MKCRDVERLLVLGFDKIPDAESREALRAHLEACARCASGAEELEGLRTALPRRGGDIPAPPAALIEKTRILCHEKLRLPEPSPGTPVLNSRLRRVPPAVWAATAGLLLMTAFILVPFFGEVLLSEPLSYVSWIGLGFIVQNVLMLLSSPLLLRRWRRAEM
jgi:hypothetical protein